MKKVGKIVHKLFTSDLSMVTRAIQASTTHSTELALRGEEGIWDNGTAHSLETSDATSL